MRTRTDRLLLGVHLPFIVYTGLAFSLARNGVASLPLSVTDYYLLGEASMDPHRWSHVATHPTSLPPHEETLQKRDAMESQASPTVACLGTSVCRGYR